MTSAGAEVDLPRRVNLQDDTLLETVKLSENKENQVSSRDDIET